MILLILIVIAVWGISQRFSGDDASSINKPVISMDPHPNSNFMFGHPHRTNSHGSVRPIGFYYEDDAYDSNECKTMFVGGSTNEVNRVDENQNPLPTEVRREEPEEREPVPTVTEPVTATNTYNPRQSLEDRLTQMRQNYYQSRLS